MMCQRNGCKQRASMRVVFDTYHSDVPGTFACGIHAQWWTLGTDGTRIGRAVGINR